MSAVNMHTSSVQQSVDDLQTATEVELISANTLGGSGDSPANDNTSGAISLNGQKTVMALIAILGLITLY